MTAATIDPAKLAALDTITLHTGGHKAPNGGEPVGCLLEIVSWVAGQPWSDQPACVSPVLGAYGRNLNDRLSDDRRQELRPLIPQLVGTAGDGLDEARSFLALDWLIRTYTPAWLDLAGLTGPAAELRALRRIADLVAAQQAGPVVRAAREKAAAAGDAAWDAAWAAARAAAGAAAWDAAWAAARAAAGDAAWAAAWAAAGAAAWDAAWAAAGDAAGAAARAAAWAAAGDAAWAAAWDAAAAALQPTIDQLQTSAIGLFYAMIRQPGVIA